MCKALQYVTLQNIAHFLAIIIRFGVPQAATHHK